MKITTKTGDNGETSLFGGRRVSKASEFIELVGELDELQAVVGWCRVEAIERNKCDKAAGEAHMYNMCTALETCLARIEEDLYRMMSIVGFEFKCPGNIKPVGEEDVEFLEKEMSKYEDAVGDLSKFVRPGGSEISARLHIARTVCRRVERGMVKVKVAGAMLKYLNRLSDLLFVLAYRFEKGV